MSKKCTPLGLLASVLIISLFTSCEYEFIEPEKVVIPDFVSFSEDIIPIFSNNCSISGCHAAGFGVLDLSADNAYDDLIRKGQIDIDVPEQSGIYQKLSDANGTHQGRSTPTEQATILEWISKGAQNNYNGNGGGSKK